MELRSTMAFIAKEVKISAGIQNHLEKLANGQRTEARLVQRAQIVLYASAGYSNAQIAKKMNISPDTCSKWRGRFVDAIDQLLVVEASKPEKLEVEIRNVLADGSRSGRPRMFSGEQIAFIMKRACQKPSKFGYERTQWTCALLAEEAVRADVVPSISARTVSRYLDKAEIRPWKTKYWLHSPDKDEDPAEFSSRIAEICNLYLRAPELREQGVHVVCVDEKTGIQALEHKYTGKPVAPGKSAHVEFEYIRHGTRTLIAGREVSDGKILPLRLGQTRKESDFVAAIRKIVATDPDAQWNFIVDGLNTHKSERLVRFVAGACGITDDLGEKGTRGILQTMKSREEFLHDKSHRIRFIYTPRHCSWVNQIEIWFGTFSRQFLRHRSSVSVKSLDAGIRRFVKQYNLTAKPYKWTYTGVPLAA